MQRGAKVRMFVQRAELDRLAGSGILPARPAAARPPAARPAARRPPADREPPGDDIAVPGQRRTARCIEKPRDAQLDSIQCVLDSKDFLNYMVG